MTISTDQADQYPLVGVAAGKVNLTFLVVNGIRNDGRKSGTCISTTPSLDASSWSLVPSVTAL